MTVFVAGYKAPGHLQDRVIRSVLSIRHGEPALYSHVEILRAPPKKGIFVGTTHQECVAASKRDNAEVRYKIIQFAHGHWDFVELNLPEQLDLWKTVREQRVGKPYDTLGAILCVTPLARLSPKADWCSGMIADLAGWENPEKYDPTMIINKARSLGGQFIEG